MWQKMLQIGESGGGKSYHNTHYSSEGISTGTNIKQLEINCGFEPKFIFAFLYSPNPTNQSCAYWYDGEKSKTTQYLVYLYVNASQHAYEEDTIPSSSYPSVRIEGITDKGFIYAWDTQYWDYPLEVWAFG